MSVGTKFYNTIMANPERRERFDSFGVRLDTAQGQSQLKEFSRFMTYLEKGHGQHYRMDASDEEIKTEIKRKQAAIMLGSQKAMSDLKNKARLDAFAGIGNHLQRDLEILDPVNYKIEYQDQSIWREFVNVRVDSKPGATNYRYKMSDFSAKIKQSSEAVSDIPMVNANKAWFYQNLTKFTGGYQITDDEIKAFMHLGETPDMADIEALDEAYTREHYYTVLNGFRDGTTEGLLNNSNFANSVVASSGAAVTWAAKKALATQVGYDAIMSDVTSLVTAQRVATQNRYWTKSTPGKIRVPIAQYMLLATTARSLAAGSDETMLGYLLKNTPGLADIEPWLDLEGAGTGGADLMIGYVPEPRLLEYIITQERMWLPVQMEGEIWKYGSNEKVAGLVVRNSAPHAYRYGI